MQNPIVELVNTFPARDGRFSTHL